MNYVHKLLETQKAKVENTEYSRQNATNSLMEKLQERQTKAKLSNTKLLAPSISQYSKNKLLEDKVCKYHHQLKYRTPSHCKRLSFSL